MKKVDPKLVVDVPPAAADQPSWVRVGVVAVLGFAIGVAWPKLAGVKLGPSAPVTQESNASTATASAGLAVAPPPKTASAPAKATEAPTPSASLVAPTPASAAPTASAPPAEGAATTIATVKPGLILGCKSEAGEKLSGKACSGLTFDALALPRLRKLAACPSVQGGVTGTFSPQFHLDFLSNKMTVQLGKKNTVDNVESLSACMGRLFEKVSINAVTHEHVRYSVQYTVTFSKAEPGKTPPAHAAAATASPAAASEGNDAKIVPDVALLRDAPRTGQILSRLQRGTAVTVIATENNWFKVRAGTTEGWLYRGAIGR